MQIDTGMSLRSTKGILLLALPALVLLLSLLAWITGLSRSGFWADDFLNLTHFYRSLGNLSDDHINTGKYVINVFWAVGTAAFGAGSVVPFLLLNTLVFAGGLVLWLWAGTKTHWSPLDAWWIGGLFIATAAWLPTVLWSSNITHSGGFLALGAAFVAHERCMSTRTRRGAVLWSLAGGAAWTLAIVSNLLYLGVLSIAAYCAWHEVLKLRQFGMDTTRAGVMVGSWSLLIPLIYFVAIGYPATTDSSAYATNGLRFFHTNFEYYKSVLAPTTGLALTYVVVAVVAIAGAVLALRRGNWFPLAVLVAAGATTAPAMIQGQQRDVHYVAMPLLLLFSAAASGARPVLVGKSQQLARLRSVLVLAAMATLIFLFRHGADIRASFVQYPYGGTLTAFRSQAAALVPIGSTVCATLNLDARYRSAFNAEMSGADGFMVPPISAAGAEFVTGSQRCPSPATSAHITVGLDARGDFVASG